jgi:hypothetical protein
MAGPVEIATCALFDSMQPQLRVSPEDGTFLRDVACGFGSSPGTYRFLLSAVGYVPKPILSAAEYRAFLWRLSVVERRRHAFHLAPVPQ